MPTISPVARAVIGGNSEEAFRQPRVSVTRSTGMELPPREAPPPAAQTTPTQPEIGQSSITEEETPPAAVTLSPQLTALARKQQKLQQEVQALRDREAQFTAKEADYIPKSSFKTKLQENAVQALTELGISYEEITNLLLSQQQGEDPVQALKAEIQEIKASQEQNVSKQYEATLKQYKAETDSLVASDPKYLLVKKGNHQDKVVQHIVETWKTDDKILTVEEATQDIETFLRDQAREQAALLKEIDGEPAETPPVEEKKLPPPKTGTRTLTQQVESAPTRTYNQFQHLSPKERLAQAIARAQK